MPLNLQDGIPTDWVIRKIGVIGPGVVGMPMAALLARAAIREGTETPAPVVVIQRPSATSGWKVDAINSGRSPIGGIEPDLERIVREGVRAGLLSASSDFAKLSDADVILVCVQTDKIGNAPDYGPLLEALDSLVRALRGRPAGNMPLIIFESTLAPSSMTTVIREHFARYGLEDGRDILLGNSPNRVMPGRLVERVVESDKIVGGLLPATVELICRLYSRIVTRGKLLPTNSLTGEVVKTLENAYRDVRIAFSAEIARWCDHNGVDFHALRRGVNQRIGQSDAASDDPTVVPTGGLLIPTTGVGGHCLPKDGILLLWRLLERGRDTSQSLILSARRINDESPRYLLSMAEHRFGSIDGKRAPFGKLTGERVALLGTAYRSDSGDTRNSPTLALGKLLLRRGASIKLHDPYASPDDQNLARDGLTQFFTQDLEAVLAGVPVVMICTGHQIYRTQLGEALDECEVVGVVDGCNLFQAGELPIPKLLYAGIGRGRSAPDSFLVEHVERCFRLMEIGVANEVREVTEYLNRHHANDAFSRIEFNEVQRLTATCPTGCRIVDPAPVSPLASYRSLLPRLVETATAGHGPVW